MSTNSDKVAGKAKEVAGKATNDKELQAKGKLQHDAAQLRDKAEDAAANAGAAAKEAFNKAKKKLS